MRRFQYLPGVQAIPTQPVATTFRQIPISTLLQLQRTNKHMMESGSPGPHHKWRVFQDGIS